MAHFSSVHRLYCADSFLFCLIRELPDFWSGRSSVNISNCRICEWRRHNALPFSTQSALKQTGRRSQTHKTLKPPAASGAQQLRLLISSWRSSLFARSLAPLQRPESTVTFSLCTQISWLSALKVFHKLVSSFEDAFNILTVFFCFVSNFNFFVKSIQFRFQGAGFFILSSILEGV